MVVEGAEDERFRLERSEESCSASELAGLAGCDMAENKCDSSRYASQSIEQVTEVKVAV